MNFVFETNSHSRQNPSLRSTWLISDQIFYSFYKWALLEIHICTKDSQNTDLASGPKGKGWISASYLSTKELLPHSSGTFSIWFTFYMRRKPVSLENFPQSTRVSLKKRLYKKDLKCRSLLCKWRCLNLWVEIWSLRNTPQTTSPADVSLTSYFRLSFHLSPFYWSFSTEHNLIKDSLEVLGCTRAISLGNYSLCSGWFNCSCPPETHNPNTAVEQKNVFQKESKDCTLEHKTICHLCGFSGK